MQDINISAAVLKTHVKSFFDKQQYQSALFWVDKLVTLNDFAPEDVILYAKCLYAAEDYAKCIHLLSQHGLIEHSELARYLVSLCLYKTEEFVDALCVLEQDAAHLIAMGKKCVVTCLDVMMTSDLDKQFPKEFVDGLEADVCLLRGKINEALENIPTAEMWYQKALQKNVMCYEAYEKLARFQPYELQNGKLLPTHAEIRLQVDPAIVEMVEFFYRGDKTLRPIHVDEASLPPSLSPLKSNLDVLTMCAENLFDVCQYHQCLEITTCVLETDPYHLRCLPMHISLLKVLGRAIDLFKLSHDLIRHYSRKAIAWYAIGSYYMCVRKFDVARKHLTKATQLDRNFAPAWLSLGHAYSAAREHDHALTAYFKAARVLRGSSVPMLYIGVEYGNSNNAALAENYLEEALRCSPSDPVAMHEHGKLKFDNERYQEAYELLHKAYNLVLERTNNVPEPFWEPLLNNLAHVCRKLGKYDAAEEYHEMALKLLPDNVSSLNALAQVMLMQNKPQRALQLLRRSLRLDSRDCVATELYQICLLALKTLDHLPFETDNDNEISFIKSTHNTTNMDVSMTDSASQGSVLKDCTFT